MIDEADIVLAITPEDKKRLIELYGTSERKIYVCPVGVNTAQKRRENSINREKKLNCLITGSLWFGPNAEGTLWVLNEVFPRVADICRLTIAGAKPNNEIRDACKKKDAVLVESPESMKPYFETADLITSDFSLCAGKITSFVPDALHASRITCKAGASAEL